MRDQLIETTHRKKANGKLPAVAPAAAEMELDDDAADPLAGLSKNQRKKLLKKAKAEAAEKPSDVRSLVLHFRDRVVSSCTGQGRRREEGGKGHARKVGQEDGRGEDDGRGSRALRASLWCRGRGGVPLRRARGLIIPHVSLQAK